MSGGQPRLHLHPPAQHGHGHVASSQPFYHPHDDDACLSAGPPPPPLMDDAHFGDFAAASFSALPGHEQGRLMAMVDEPRAAAAAAAAAAAHLAQHHAMVGPLPHHSHAMASMAAARPARTLRADSENRRSSLATDDDGGPATRNSPASNSLDDPATDEFGLDGPARPDAAGLAKKDGKLHAPPPWSELKTKAGKDRKRLPLACIACRRKKIRCSGEKPACKHCLRSRIPCVYKVTTRKAAPRTDYMAMLDKRLKRMEERIIKIIPKADQDAAPALTRAVVKPAIPGSGPSARPPPSRKRAADEAFGPDLDAWARAPPPRPKAAEPADDELPEPADRDDEDTRLSQEGFDALPLKEVQEHLAEVFFDNVYGQAYHLLHKPSYMRRLKSDALPPVLVLAVCAVAARFTSNPAVNSSEHQFLRGEEWASHARAICTRRYEWPNITILTCLLLLGLHEFGTCHGGRSWALGGQAIRMAFALQLHRDLEYDPLCRNKTPLSFVDREIRRRIMWACFLMDRFNSSGSDRPMFIREESMRIQLPAGERFFQLDMPVRTESLDGSILLPAASAADDDSTSQPGDNMGVAAYTIRSIAMWGRTVAYLNQGGREMDPHPMWSPESDYAALVGAADDLVRTLPPALQYSPQNLELHITDKTASQFALLHLSMQQSILFLNQAALALASPRAAGQEPAPRDFVTGASARTLAAANRISDIIKDCYKSQCSVSAPFAGYCVFSSTNVHIAAVFSANAAAKATAETNFRVNIRFLGRMMKLWGVFRWMVEIIRTHYRRAVDASRSGRGPGSPTPPVVHYGDWFSKYPYGVSDSDLADATLQRKRDKAEDGVLEAKPEMQSVEEFFTTLSPAQSSDCQKRAAGPKPKQAAKRRCEAPTPAANGEPQKTAGQRPSPRQKDAHPLLPARFAPSLGGQTSGPASFSPLTAPQGQGAYAVMSPISPAQVGQFSQQQPGRNPFFPGDVLSLNVPPRLDRQVSLGGFAVDSVGRMSGSPSTMDASMSAWGGLAGKGDGQRSPKAGVGMPAARHSQGHVQMMPLHAMADLNGQGQPGRFFSFLDAPDMGQDMGPGGSISADPFTSIFGGGGSMMTPTQLEALRHSL